MKRQIIHAACLILFAGCVKQVEWPLPGDVPERIAVEAILTSERKIQTVTLSHPVADLNDTPEPVTGATVLVSTSDSLWFLEKDPLHPGAYRTDSLFMALPDREYTLEIHREGRNYSAKASMAPGKVFNELVYQPDDDGELYHIDWVASAFSVDYPAMWEVLIDWSFLPGFDTLDPSSCRARLCFFTLSTLDVSQVFAPVVEQISFPAGTLINERRYSLTPAHAEYLRQLLLETNWQGGLFPTANANVITNLSPGAIGFFGVCAVTELSLVVE